jgi:hypothetical protein
VVLYLERLVHIGEMQGHRIGAMTAETVIWEKKKKGIHLSPCTTDLPKTWNLS